ncbi:MAG TPA: hypothetical protein VMU87_17925 [Stellaceae bacterium]|nr:hypothetical protein [Stellaceae bacterium]
MTCFVYAVRCNFAQPDLEDQWNAWYSGPKLEEMLRKPHFLSVQRFTAAALDTRRKYLALWIIASPDAFTTEEYRSDWGFFAWTSHIRDWSRDLYRATLDATDPLFDIGPGEALYRAGFDGRTDEAARSALERVRTRRPGVAWLEAAGLDRHAPILGLKKIAATERVAPLAGPDAPVETVFAPLTRRFVASQN